MRAASKIERPKMVTELVHERLRQDIVNGVFDLGEKISEGQIAEFYGVTKAPIRKAYTLLQAEGLIEIRPQSGSFVFRPTREDLRAICELRIALEVEAARLALRRSQDAVSAEIAGICTEMEEALAGRLQDSYLSLDARFHMTLMDHADSPYLREIYSYRVASIFSALRSRFAQDVAHNEASIAEHIQIRDAIAANDLDALTGLIRRHVRNTERYYEKWVGT